MSEFEKAKEAGEAAVVITLASKFSGTYQSALIAAEDYENIYVVDSGSAAMGSGILVELAFRLLDEGKSAEEIARILEEEKKKIVIVALGAFMLLIEFLMDITFGLPFVGWSIYPLAALVLLGGLLLYFAINQSARETMERKLFF